MALVPMLELQMLKDFVDLKYGKILQGAGEFNGIYERGYQEGLKVSMQPWI